MNIKLKALHNVGPSFYKENMSELQTSNHEVTVLFRQGTSLLIPPTGLPREARRHGETQEKTLYRLCDEHGVNASIDRMIPRPLDLDEDDRVIAYLVQPKYGELERTELLVPHEEVNRHLEAHVRLSRIDTEIVRSALVLISLRSS